MCHSNPWFLERKLICFRKKNYEFKNRIITTHDFYVRFLLDLVSLQEGCLLILHQKKFPQRLTGDRMDVLVSKVVLTHRRRRRCQTVS